MPSAESQNLKSAHNLKHEPSDRERINFLLFVQNQQPKHYGELTFFISDAYRANIDINNAPYDARASKT